MFDILWEAKCRHIVVYLANDFFSIWLQMFFHYVAHLVGLASSISPWLVTLHLWSTFGPYGDPPYSLHPWWGKDGFPWCCVGCLCIYHKRCKISGFMWVNPCSSITYSLIYMLVGWHCGFGGWCLDIGWHCYHWLQSSRFGFTRNFILWYCH